MANPTEESPAGVAGPAAVAGPVPADRPRAEARKPGPARSAVPTAVLAALGAACGVSTLAGGFYDVATWGLIAIGVAALALGLVAAGAGRPRLVPALAVGGLAGLWLWSWLSTLWAESGDQALVHAGRWALYAAALLALVLLTRRRRDRWVALAAATAGILGVALYVMLEMGFGDGTELFFGGRLRDPLGYVNGQAGYFLLGFWPCVAVAERTRRPLLAGAGAAGAVMLAALLVLSQSRGVVPSLAASAVVVLVLVPGRARRVWVLVAVGIAIAAISGPLLDVFRDVPADQPADGPTVARAGKLILTAALVLGGVWAAVSLALHRGSATVSPSARRALDRAEGALAVVVAAVALGGLLVAVGDPIERVERQYDQFVNLQVGDPGDTRFLSGGGYRYDYWRVAWLEFKDAPVRGVGGGNYDVRYFAERRTNEDIRQPHSLEMQVLAELGIVGILALLMFVGAVFAGLWRTARRGRKSTTLRMLAVAAGGAFAAWLMHTSVDWLHALPGVTGVALCAAAGLVAPWSHRAPGRAFGTPRILALIATGAAAFAAADLTGRLAAAERFRVDGRAALNSDPVEALRQANRSLALNGSSLPALYIESAAYARVGNYLRSRRSLREATRLEPSDPLPWMLLGDLAVRRGRIGEARAAYLRAATLDPRNEAVKALAKDPRSALPGGE